MTRKDYNLIARIQSGNGQGGRAMTRDRRAHLWAELNARPFLDRRAPSNPNTVAHEGTAFQEIGYVQDPNTHDWRAPIVLACGESLNFSASDTAENKRQG